MTRRWSWARPIFALIAGSTVIIAAGPPSYDKPERPPDEWVVPFGYTGPVKIYYGVPTMPSVSINPENGARRFEINADGFLLTSNERIVTDKPYARIFMSKPDGSQDILRWCYENSERFCTELTITDVEFQLEGNGINMFLVCEQGDACTEGSLSEEHRGQLLDRFKETDALVRRLTGMERFKHRHEK